MSLPTLPQEVLELILLYVTAEDVLSVLKMLGRPGSEALWRKICLQNGYEKLSREEETWKEVVLRNIAWLSGFYLKNEYDLDDLTDGLAELKRPTQSSSNTLSLDYIKTFPYLKGNRLVCQKDDEVLLMNAGNPKILCQQLQGQNQEHYNQSGTKLLVQTSSSFVIYDKYKDNYKEMFDLNKKNYNMCPYVLTDDYFVLVAFQRLTVVCLNDKEGYSLRISMSKNINFCNWKKVVDRILNILVLEDTIYYLRRFDLERREWLDDLQLFRGAFMISVPQIEMNHKFAVSCCLPLEGRIASIKIWSLEENTRRVSMLTRLMTDRILWLLLHTNYLIYSSNCCWFSILNLNKPDEPETTVECDKGPLGQTIVSRFLVLSYKNGFKLVDFKKATYVREVFFSGGFAYDYFYVNEYFYIVYNVPSEAKGQKKLCVYDFRVGSL